MLNTSALVTHRMVRVTSKKNPAAVALGRLGGKVGGKIRMQTMSKKERAEFAAMGGAVGGRARARKLSSKRRIEIARKAAAARWAKAKRG
jgi:hypothetical protein